jgi:lipopolysaccharide transport protein LptA
MTAALALVAAAALPAGPLDFKARDMRIEPQERRIVLDGDVQLVRGNLDVQGRHAVAEYAKERRPAAQKQKRGARSQPSPADASFGGQSVERFTVTGDVKVRRGQRTADGELGVFDVPAQTLVLTGTPEAPPVVRDGSETLSGDRILLRLDSDDLDVVRPKVVLRRSLTEQGSAPATPVKVEASHLVLLQARRLAQFTDDVVLRQGDTVARSPKMEARYDGDGQLTKLEMRGGVDVRQGDRRATGETADYDARARTLVLQGDPKLYDKGDVLTGDRIDLALDSKEVRVEKARGRLRPEIHKGERGEP